MRRIVEIIPSKRWVNIKDGRIASIYGAVPYVNESEKPDWQVEITGYTWKLNDGTIGLGRPASQTMVEAERIRDAFNARD